MFLKDINELFEKVIFMYQFSYTHYILGKYKKMEGSFPDRCCGRSAKNVLIALWEAGIISAVKVGNNPHDHAYVVIPFIVKSITEGIIFIDPTSDQLFTKEERKVRNLIRIVTERKWEYRTDWAHGANLYPDKVEGSASFGYSEKDYDEYIEQALQNPVVVTT